MAALAAVDRQPVLLGDVGQAPSSVQHQPCWDASQTAGPAVAPTWATATLAAFEVVNDHRGHPASRSN